MRVGHDGGCWWMVVASCAVLSACGNSGKEALLSSVGDADRAADQSGYEKPAGVAFHIPALLGMDYAAFLGSDVEKHLGTVVETKRLPGVRGKSIRYEKGEILVARGRIYGVNYELDHPAELLEALHVTGLPEALSSDFVATSRELRIERSPFGFRRLVVVREKPWADRFVAVRAWSLLPQEKY